MNDETNTQPNDENGGMCADIDTLADVPYAVAPSVEKRINTIRLAFLPTVCWRIDDDRFDFDSSFILPTSTREFAMLADKRPPGPPAEPGTGPYVHVVQSGEWLDGIAKSYGFESWRDLYYADENAAYRTSHPDPNVLYPGDEIVIPGRTGGDTSKPQEDPNGLRLTVFGHADPTGRDDYNQVLAGRRAKAVYALLVRDVDMWDELYRVSHGGDEWTLRHIQIMLVKCGYDAGDPDGVLGTNTLDATRAFQRDQKFPASGYVDVTTRKKLFRAYMNAICVDSKHEPFQYNRKDFLSRGETKDGKADYQSCSEFNPMVVFSQEEEAEYAKPENKGQRDADNAVNRRVTIYMFPPKPRFPPEKWPCPTLKEGCGKCKGQFWIDGEKRRSAQGERRDSRKRGKTMACKWYDRIVWRGSCEGKKTAKELVLAWVLSRFSPGRTFPKPSCLQVLQEVAFRLRDSPNLNALIMGHADDTESTSAHSLSLGRARSIAALLTGDSEFFLDQFANSAEAGGWGWNEVQWMLSAIQPDNEACYAGIIDGHCGTMTRRALGSFQLSQQADGKSHHVDYFCDQATLKEIVGAYLELIERPEIEESRITTHGGGSWHDFREPPTISPAIMSESDDEQPNNALRRVDVFLGESFRPAPANCAAAPHKHCPAYARWWSQIVEVIEGGKGGMPIRIVDECDKPIVNHSISVTPAGNAAGAQAGTTSESGHLIVQGDPGLYVVEIVVDLICYTIPLFLDTDESGGATLRIERSGTPNLDD